MQIKKQLLEKYNKPVPRYTSYPPANFFGDIDENEYLNLIEESNITWDKNVSIYIHIPFCKQLCFYCGCNMSVLKDKSMIEKYFETLKKEIYTVLPLIDKNRKLSQIHYWWWTPNTFPVEYLKELNEIFFDYFENTRNMRISQKQKVQERKIFSKWVYEPVNDWETNFSDDEIWSFSDNSLEVAIECHPAYIDEDYINWLIDAWFNRLSIWIQDTKTEVLSNINRLPSHLPLQELFEMIRSKKSDIDINLDFIYWLPGQTNESFLETLRKAILLKPNRIVTFSYAHVPTIKPHQKTLEMKWLPSSLEKADMFKSSRELFLSSWYEAIWLDHYVLPDDDLNIALQNHNLHRNFQWYCTRETTGQVYAFWISSISQFDSAYIQNEKNFEDYMELINSKKLSVKKWLILTENQKIIRYIVEELMCNYFLDFKKVCSIFDISLEDLKSLIWLDKNTFSSFIEDKLMTFENDIISVSEVWRFFIRNIVASLDPALKGDVWKTFSKSV